MKMSLLFSLLFACVPEPAWTESEQPDVDELAMDQLLSLADPATALSMLDGLTLDLDQASSCEVARFPDGQGERETWSACPGELGTVERYEDNEIAWMEVSHLALPGGFRMDGAIERSLDGELASLEMAATLCGSELADCEAPVQVDLSWNLVNLAPGRIEVLVTGTVVTSELGPVAVEGSYLVDAQRCDEQPVEGLLLLEGEETWTFRFDGACDDCAELSVDGSPAGSLCLDGE